MTITETPGWTSVDIVAEAAPIGVQVWPTHREDQAPNFTLAEVAVIRTSGHPYVLWTYESGTTRTFNLGERIASRVRDEDIPRVRAAQRRRSREAVR